MNILIVVPDLSIGGAEVTAVNLANNFVKLGHSVFFFECYFNRNKELINELNKDVQIVTFEPLTGVKRALNKLINILFGKSRFNNKVDHYYQAKHFNSIIENYNIHTINSHLPSADFFVYMTLNQKKLDKINWVVSMHGSYENSRKDLPLSKVIFNKVNGVVYLTKRNLNILDHYPDHKISTNKIYNCLGDWQLNKKLANISNDLTHRKFTFGIISRGDYNKGWLEAIEAVLRLNTNGFACDLILGGEGDAKLELESRFKNETCIRFVGFIDNPLQFISTFDVGLLPSYFESLPYTIIEYLHMQIPTIATNVGEIKPMIISNNETVNAGQIIEWTGDSEILIDELEKAMLNYLNDPELFQLHKRNTVVLYEQFSPDNWGVQYVQFFKESMRNIAIND